MRLIRDAELAAYDVWDKLPRSLQGLDTRVIYISPDRARFDLIGGPMEGRQGVYLSEEFQGEHHWPFELLLTEGAYELGATVERTNILKREISLGVTIGGHTPPLTNYQYRMAESRWWDGQDENRDGWLGIYTRFSGWRWLRVRPSKTVTTGQSRDPVYAGNNTATWSINWIAQKPYYSKPALFKTFKVSDAGSHTGIITLANRGDLPIPTQFIVSAPGQASVEDGTTGRMVELPYLAASDGYTLCDTDRQARTLTASNDPVDNVFYQIARQSKILDFFLHDIIETGLPVWKRFDKRFMATVPPRTIAQIHVKHDNPHGTITAVMPQRYKRSR